MKNGLYSVKFTVAGGEGGGVVVLRDGRLLGGEQGSYYIGTYHTDDGKLVADVKVKTHTMAPGMTYVLGPSGGDVHLEGTNSGDTAHAIATSPQAPGIVFDCHFQWLSD
ncbi:UNVERIFIED_ORG: hypothetical protein QE446_003829 [Rhizobium sp. SORGH_AS260]|uniref:GrlR family regulatory protein n=1 Tax=Agrobacterium sp. SORGH_AS_0440 TaxID=3041757 RepID=UPI0027881F2B|nr:GrlR family regulatory protein [Agrobacterium sp. SORGH_AS_0440]MDP9732214.1 hypothetical protein [Rhizobium sp. SORGH_AS_0285]MDP9755953.1 hypothetical protein [Rhizobium sp. SORGH_AS_0260]MDR6081386.1 hypothetical protein [Agrobacterium sp. SORGH_AS_0440]